MAEPQVSLLRASTKVTAVSASNAAKYISRKFRQLKSAMTKRINTCVTIWITHTAVHADKICRMSQRLKMIRHKNVSRNNASMLT